MISTPVLQAQEATPAAFSTERAITFYPTETGFGTFIELHLSPGETGHMSLTVGNTGHVEQTVRVYAVPAGTAVNGGFQALEHGAEPDYQTSWIDYEESDYKLVPEEGRVLKIDVHVPDDALPGEYVTAMAAEHADAYDIEGSDLIKQRVRWAVPILIVIPGEAQPAFTLPDASLEDREGLLIASVSLENTGNVIVRPRGEVRLLSPDGTVLGVSSLELLSFYPGTSSSFLAAWKNVPQSETFTLQVVLANEDGSVTVQETFPDLVPTLPQMETAQSTGVTLGFPSAELTPLTDDNPPSMLQLTAEIANNGEPIENARVSIVTYQDGVEVDRYPVMQAVTIPQGTTPVQARYALPGGFTSGTYTFDVTIELGDMGTQTILVTHKLEFEVTVP
ncbi:MAG: DUF916 domain-containing protein [Thermomicrobiales bacterium]|nr:DUF916 domain-containing protein [Thermomicrobiales bacterium]